MPTRVLVHRQRGGSRDIFRAYKLLLDGEEVARIRRGQDVEFAITSGRHVLQAKIDWCTSPAVEFDVEDGACAEFDCAPGGSALTGLGDVGFGRKGSYVDLVQRTTT